jgi:hypothetical protein
MRWAGHGSTYWEIRTAFTILAEKPQGKRQLGGERHRCESDIKLYFRGKGCGGMEWSNGRFL